MREGSEVGDPADPKTPPAPPAGLWPADDRYADKKAQMVSLALRLRNARPVFAMPEGITEAEANVMHAIEVAMLQGSAPRPGSIARFAHVTPSALSQTLGSLEQKGLIARERGDGDMRSVVVRMTDAGLAKMAQLKARANDYWTALLDYLGARDVEDLIRIAGRIVVFRAGEAARTEGAPSEPAPPAPGASPKAGGDAR